MRSWGGNPNISSLDMWTAQDGSGGVHVKWDNTGLIQGQRNQFEFWAERKGFWMNTTTGFGQYLFNRNKIEQGRLGNNNHWRFGLNPIPINAVRRVEVFEAGKVPQFRLTANPASATFVDFRARANGNLNILPSGKKVGINHSVNPTHTLDINGKVRIRNTPIAALPQSILIGQQYGVGASSRVVHRLDFTGNPGQVLLGNGTWGTLPTINSFGTACGSLIPAQLTATSEIQLNDFHFTGINSSNTVNNVGIGTQCYAPLPGKLTVNQQTNTKGTTGIYVVNRDDANPALGSPIALYAKAIGTDAFSGCNTVAGWFEAKNSFGQNNIAICVPASGGNVNIGFATPDITSPPNEPNICALNFGGLGALLSVNGDIWASGGILTTSDIAIKTNIVPITSALDKVKKLNGVYFDYDNTSFPILNLPSSRQVGLIAQNVDSVLTEVVQFDSTMGVYTLDYSRINALVIEAIKEQDVKMEELEAKLAEMQDCLDNTGICDGDEDNDRIGNTQTIELSNLNAIILDQNLPNPFAEKTTINCKLYQLSIK